MLANWVYLNEEELKQRNYVRKTPGYATCVFFEESKLEDYRCTWGDAFNLIVAGSREIEDDFYVLPYREIRHMLVKTTIKVQKDGRRRWHLSIEDEVLRVANLELPVGQMRGVRIDLA